MGAEVQDHQIGRDLAAGVLSVRIVVGLARPPAHHPSPPLGRRSLWRLWLWRWRRGALPPVLEAWWWALDQQTRPEIRRLVEGVRIGEWVSWWLDLPAEDPPEPEGVRAVERAESRVTANRDGRGGSY